MEENMKSEGVICISFLSIFTIWLLACWFVWAFIYGATKNSRDYEEESNIHMNKKKQKMKVSNTVIQQYQKICPTSSFKCDSVFEIEYKIKRSVDLGKVVALLPEKKEVVRYFNLCFITQHDKVIDMFLDKSIPEYPVSEFKKMKYDEIHSKVVV